jgi:hypothetical protein
MTLQMNFPLPRVSAYVSSAGNSALYVELKKLLFRLQNQFTSPQSRGIYAHIFDLASQRIYETVLDWFKNSSQTLLLKKVRNITMN